ncbi:protein BIG GRAIN 1-like D [Maniola jurtina]|uniref:protein BIG GRAIN 1-like D n=1 Tax=Maniola jurtina TaxID=191418 RepID=UPI001E68E8BA|nr:protein BIG GRAIN 1-like D [Maniola jurtina]
MNSKASNSNVYNPSLSSNVTVTDKETQTSIISVNLMSSDHTQGKPTPKDTNTTCKDDNIKVFEFCELIRDPEDDTVSIVKETFTEEVLTSSEGSLFGKPTHNRYKYSREVIQPFCKVNSTACPKYPIHRDIPFKKSSSNTSKDSKKEDNGSSSTMSSDGKKTTFENPSTTLSSSSIKEDGKKRPCPPSLPINNKKECQKEATDCKSYPKCPQYKDEAKLKEYLSSCLSTTVTMAKKASATCLEKCEKTIGIRPPKCGKENPTYYVLEKPKSKESVVDKSSYEGILESEVVQNFTSGVKGIVDTVINKTKETVNTFTGGSCNALESNKPRDIENKILKKVASILPNKFKSQEDNEENSQNSSLTKIKSSLSNIFKSQDNETTKKSSLSQITNMLTNPFKSQEDNAEANKSSLTKITSIFTNIKSKDDSDSENKSLTRIKSVISNTLTNTQDYATSVKDSINMSKMAESATAAFERVTSAVSATISTVKDVKESLSMTNIINSRLDKSSPEDDPNIVRRIPPENISHEHGHSPESDNNNQSIFTMLKSKLFSMFADDTEDDDDSDDDDEITADTIFKKYCDQ